MDLKLDDAIKQLKEGTPRRFAQSVDLVVNIKNIDLKKPENKFSKRVVMPHGTGKDVDVCLISEKGQAKKADIEEFGRNKSAAKNFVKKYDFFLCEAPLMPLVGKILGRYMGPKGKMPELLVPGRDPQNIIDELKRSARIRIRDSPTVQVMVGAEKMPESHLKENALKIMEEIKKSLPPKAQIKNVMIKTTMGRPIRVSI